MKRSSNIAFRSVKRSVSHIPALPKAVPGRGFLFEQIRWESGGKVAIGLIIAKFIRNASPMDADFKPPLSPLQVELLKAFSTPAVDGANLLEIRKMLSQYFARKASAQAQQITTERGLSASDVEAIAPGSFVSSL